MPSARPPGRAPGGATTPYGRHIGAAPVPIDVRGTDGFVVVWRRGGTGERLRARLGLVLPGAALAAPADGLTVAAWSDPARGEGPALLDVPGRPGALVARAGRVRSVHHGPRPAPAQALADPAGRDLLRGTYAVTTLAATGHGLTFADPMGLRFVHLASRRDTVVVGTDAAVVATLAAPGRAIAPARASRSEAVCALAHNGYRWPGRTGFDGVRTLEPDEVVAYAPGARPTVVRTDVPWLPAGGATEGATPAELLALVHDELRASFATVDLDDPDLRIELTGGKDSRLVLALALEQRPAAALATVTSGPPELGDVLVADLVARTLGVRHTVEHRPGGGSTAAGSADDLAARARAFVERTAGMVSVRELRGGGNPRAGLRVSGLNGEALRGHVHPRGDADPGAGTDVPASTLGLLHPDAATALGRDLRRLHDRAAGRATATVHPADVAESVLFRLRARQRYGPIDVLHRRPRALPLYAPAAVRAAFALGPEWRLAELVHHHVIAAVDPRLLQAPFAGAGWSPALRAALPAPEHAPAPLDARPLRAVALASLPTAWRALFDDLVADAGNPAWAVVDRLGTREALDAHDELPFAGRRELHGAMTAALWLAG